MLEEVRAQALLHLPLATPQELNCSSLLTVLQREALFFFFRIECLTSAIPAGTMSLARKDRWDSLRTSSQL